MKVLHIAETLVGGIASHLDEIIPAQCQEFGETNVRLIVPNSHINHLNAGSRASISAFEYNGRNLRALSSLRKRINEELVAFKPDILHVHSTFAGAVVRTLPRRLRGRLVYCPHGWPFAQEGGVVKRRAYALAESMFSLRTDAILNVSQHEFDLAARYGLPTRRMHVIRNGISESAPDHRSSGVEFDARKLNVLYVGRFDRQKGIDYLVDEMATMKDDPIHFHVVGNSVLSKPLVKIDDVSNATFYGWQPRDRVFELMSAADAVVMPSRWEGLPLTGLEAMRSGTALLASKRSSFPEMIEHGVTGFLFDFGAPGSLSSFLRKTNRSELKSMGAKGRLKFLSEFTSARQVREISDLYRSLTTIKDGLTSHVGLPSEKLTSLRQGSGDLRPFSPPR